MHQIGASLLLILPTDMINTIFPDYMHWALLGVMKRTFDVWLHGVLVNPNRLLPSSVQTIGTRIVPFQTWTPLDLQRLCRHVDAVERRKATEFCMLLLYVGPLCLKGLLPGGAYEQFFILSISTYIFPHIFLYKNVLNLPASFQRLLYKSFLIFMVCLI